MTSVKGVRTVDDDILTFQLYRTLSGSIRPADVYRRNGRRAMSVRPTEDDTNPPDRADAFTRHRAVLAANLTPTEARTWHRLLSGRSIAAIAAEEGVKRAAIYARIRGTRGKGGMVRKNRWVRAWWARRQRTSP